MRHEITAAWICVGIATVAVASIVYDVHKVEKLQDKTVADTRLLIQKLGASRPAA